MLLLGGAMPAAAQGVTTCTLSAAEVGDIEGSVGEGPGIVSPQASFVVGYSLAGAAPVICAGPGVGIAPPQTETTVVPGPMDILAAEEAFFVRYQVNRENGPLEKRFCHTVGVEGQTDCFILFSVATPEDPDQPQPPLDFGKVTVSTAGIVALLAVDLGIEETEVPPFVQASPGIASQVCQEGANQLAQAIRESGSASCEAVVTSEAFTNLVEQQLP